MVYLQEFKFFKAKNFWTLYKSFIKYLFEKEMKNLIMRNNYYLKY